MVEETLSSFNSHDEISGVTSANNDSSNSSTTVKKPLRKFKSQSVNNLFKPNTPASSTPSAKNSSQLSRDHHHASASLHLQSHLSNPTPISNNFNNITNNITNKNSIGYTSQNKYSPVVSSQASVTSKNGVKTLSLASGPKLKIIPEKRLATTPLGQNNNSNSLLNNNSPFTSKLINDDNNYWKKSRSTSPDTKKDLKPKEIPAEPKKVESSRFTFSNILLPQTTTSGFNWADIDDEDDDSFNDKIWSSLATQVEFPTSSNTNKQQQQQPPTPKTTTIAADTTSSKDILSPPTTDLPIQPPQSLVSPNIDSTTAGEFYTPMGDQSIPVSNGWNNTSPLLDFGRHGSSSLNFNEQHNQTAKGNEHHNNDHSININTNNNGNHNNNGQYFNKQNNFRGYTGSLSSSFDKLSFAESNNNNNNKFTGSEPVKQELYNPITGKIEVFATNNHNSITANTGNNTSNIKPHHHSFDSSYINHNTNSKADLWRASSTVWNSRENSLTNTGISPAEDYKPFSPNLNESISSPGWSSNLEPRNKSDSLIDVVATTPNTLRGASRFFPSPMADQHNNEYFPQQGPTATATTTTTTTILKRHSSDPFDPLSSLPLSKPRQSKVQNLSQTQQKSELITRSQQPLVDKFEKDEEDEIPLSLPSLKYEADISTAKDTIDQFVLNDSVKHPEGFSSTFYKRGVNNFMFVRELQSKVAINKIRGYDYAEFRINIPISQSSMEKLTANQDPEAPNRIKRSYIINIDVKELEGKPSRRAPPPSSSSSSTRSATNTYIRPGYNGNGNNARKGSSNSYVRKGV